MSLSLPSMYANRYTIHESLGDGGFARTYLATDSVLQRQVALKVLRREYAEVEEFASRFDREAQSAARVNHPNVVPIYDFGRESAIPFIVMQYVDGPSLKEYVRDEGPLTIEEAIDFTRQILDGLSAIHDQGIVHRDVKPQNVLLDKGKVAKLTDFGVAAVPLESTLTSAGTTVGTAAYMAPEQASGESVGPQADLYSVGVILYELLTGQLPFKGDNPVQVMYRHVSEMPPPPRTLNSSIPVQIEAVVLRALSKAPEDRYADARAMRDALLGSATNMSEVTRQAEVVAPLPPRDERPTRAGRGRPPDPPTPPPTRTAGRSRRWPLLLFLMLLLLAVAILAGVVLADGLGLVGDDDDDPTPTTEEVTAPTEAAEPTETATPTPEPPTPTETLAPTPEPTATATLEPTPEPTATEPPPPTETPEPPIPALPATTPTPADDDDDDGDEDPTESALGPILGDFNTPFPVQNVPPDWRPGANDDFQRDDLVAGGAYRRPDGELYGRPAAHLYSQGTEFPSATVTFEADEAPASYIGIVIIGMDDENDSSVPMRLALNGNVIWEGGSPFRNEEWTQVAWQVEDLTWVQEGANQLTIEVLAEGGEFGLPPWILLNRVQVFWN